MTTQRKRARQERALARLFHRMSFWEEKAADGYDIVQVKGKACSPVGKLQRCEIELEHLTKKGVKLP